MTKIATLMQFLARAVTQLAVSDHVYIVGGAVRNHVLGLPPKDLDLVVDSVALGGDRDSAWLAEKLQKLIPVRCNLTSNQYGVAILTISESWVLYGYDMRGEVLEIANARKESYGEASGKGYKPHMVVPATIKEDLARREFTFNTLLWRLGDLEYGPENAPVLDLLERGRSDLEARLLTTPVDPDKTFGDDPTRMLRAVRFVAKYDFAIDPEVRRSIQRNAYKLMRMPWDAVRKILVEDILEAPEPRKSVVLLQELGLAPVLRMKMDVDPGFATAVGRGLPEHDIHLVLDLVDLGWPVRTPVSFLDAAGLRRLREILLSNASDVTFEKRFLDALKRPPLNQVLLFERYNLQGADRGTLVPMARALLLEDPSLCSDVKELEVRVEVQIKARFVPSVQEVQTT